MRYYLSALFCCFVFFAAAQLKWTPVDSFAADLPPSVKVYYTDDSLDGKPFIAYYIEADLKDKDLVFTTQVSNGKRMTPSQFYASENNRWS